MMTFHGGLLSYHPASSLNFQELGLLFCLLKMIVSSVTVRGKLNFFEVHRLLLYGPKQSKV